MEAVFAIFGLMVWLGLGFFGARVLYLDFLPFVSNTGPHFFLFGTSLILGPIGLLSVLIAASPGSVSPAFNFNAKSPNPKKEEYVAVLGYEALFKENLLKWDMARKMLLYKPWDKVDEAPLSRTGQILAERARQQEMENERQFELERNSHG